MASLYPRMSNHYRTELVAVMSKETLEKVDQEKVINGVIACHRTAIAHREQAIERLEEELQNMRGES